MAALNSRTVTSVLAGLRAEHHLPILRTALGRQAALNALAALAGGLAAAIADLDEKVCPIENERDRSRKDRRWHSFLTAMDRAARRSHDLDRALQKAAKLCPRAITDLEPVLYHGSLTTAHGEWILTGSCDDCLDDRDGLTLRRYGSTLVLTCVNPGSISPAPLTDDTGLHTAESVQRALRAAIDDLAPSIEAEHAVTLVRAMKAITGQVRSTLDTWPDLIRRQLCDSWLLDPTTGGGARHHREHINATLAAVGGALADITAELQQAISALVGISEHPVTAGVAA